MTYEFTNDIFRKNSRLKAGIILLIIVAVCFVGIAVTTLLFYEELFEAPSRVSANSVAPMIIAGFGGIGFALLIAGGILLIIGGTSKARISRFVNEYGEDKLLNELNHPLCLLGTEKKPVTIIGKDIIYDVSHGFVKTGDIDYCYGYRYKNSTSLSVHLYHGRGEYICSGIDINGQSIKTVTNAIKQVNPDLLVGYTNYNAIAHRERVQAYAEAKRTGREFKIKKYRVLLNDRGEDEKKLVKAIKKYTSATEDVIVDAINKPLPSLLRVCNCQQEANDIVKSITKAGASAHIEEI